MRATERELLEDERYEAALLEDKHWLRPTIENVGKCAAPLNEAISLAVYVIHSDPSRYEAALSALLEAVKPLRRECDECASAVQAAKDAAAE